MLSDDELASLEIHRDTLRLDLFHRLLGCDANSKSWKFGEARSLKIAKATSDTYYNELLAVFTALDRQDDKDKKIDQATKTDDR